MNRRIQNLTRTLLTLGLVWAAAPQAFALGGDSINAGNLSIGGRGTYNRPIDADGGNWSGGGQVRIHFSPTLAAEGSVDYRRSDYGTTQVHSWPVQASLLFNLIPNSPFSLFALAGAGWYYTTVDPAVGDDDTESRFGPHAGGGVQFFLNKTWSIDSTYRYIWLKDIESNNVLTADYDESGHMITAGLNFHFGGGE